MFTVTMTYTHIYLFVSLVSEAECVTGTETLGSTSRDPAVLGLKPWPLSGKPCSNTSRALRSSRDRGNQQELAATLLYI